MLSTEAIKAAAERLAAEAGPGARIFLFGSHARGEAGPHSDLDFLVIEPQVAGRHAEMGRLRRALRGFDSPVDLIVYSEEEADRFGRTWGHAVRQARAEEHRARVRTCAPSRRRPPSSVPSWA